VLIIFVWTPPHFWALAIFRRDDYARAMVPMLPVTHGVEYTRLAHPAVHGAAGGGHGAALGHRPERPVLPRRRAGAGAVFVWHAWRLLDPPDEFHAMRVFNYSIVYLMALFAFLLVDHWLLPYLQPAPLLELQRVG
jgi:heme o synthase